MTKQQRMVATVTGICVLFCAAFPFVIAPIFEKMFRDYYANAWDEAKLRRHLAAPVAVRDRVELEERLARLVERGEPR